MSRRMTVIALAAAFLFGGAGTAAAQIFTPTHMSPRIGGDLGVYLSDGIGRGGDFAFEGIWRRNLGGYDLGFRGGVADAGDAVLLLGADLRSPVRVTDFPLALAFTAGVQAGISDNTAAGFQAGVSLGQTFAPGNFAVTPYLHPRIGLISGFGDDDLEASVLADIGFDFEFQPNLVFRIGFGLAEETADWSVGLAWR